jgi:hypothetical protein
MEDQVGAHDLTNNGTTLSDDRYSGVEGGSRDFDGTNDNMTAATPLATQMMFGCLFNLDNVAPATDKTIMGKWLSNNGLMLYLVGSTSKIRMFWAGNNIEWATALTTGWHSALCTSGGVGKYLYIDGVLRASIASGSAHGTTGSTSWEIGSFGNNISTTRIDGRVSHAWATNSQPAEPVMAGIAARLTNYSPWRDATAPMVMG